MRVLAFPLTLFAIICLIFLHSCNNDAPKQSEKNFQKAGLVFEDLPQYTNKLQKNEICKKSTIFGGCSTECTKGNRCICEGNIFSCSCSCVPQKALLSVSEEQYKNWQKLSRVLRQVNTPQIAQAHNILVEMIKNLIDNQIEQYNQNAEKFINILKNLNQEEKEKLKKLLKQKNIDPNLLNL